LPKCKADAESHPIPRNLKKRVKGIVDRCDDVAQDIENTLRKHEKGKLAGAKWDWSGRDDMAGLRTTLHAHKSALELALEMIALYVSIGEKLRHPRIT